MDPPGQCRKGRRGVMKLAAKALRKLRQHSPFEFAFGFLLARRFTSSGLIIVRPGFPKPRVINHGGEIIAGNCAFFPGVRLEVLRGGRIAIGDGTYLNRNVLVVAAREVRIGHDCKIAWDVVIMDTDQHSVDGVDRSAPVIIEDNVWVGCRAIVLKGVRIGNDAVIGAGAIVTKDVPAGAVVAGPAAAIVRHPDEVTDQAFAVAELAAHLETSVTDVRRTPAAAGESGEESTSPRRRMEGAPRRRGLR